MAPAGGGQSEWAGAETGIRRDHRLPESGQWPTSRFSAGRLGCKMLSNLLPCSRVARLAAWEVIRCPAGSFLFFCS